ncbi:hypothetical protein [Dyadobacter sp. 3J3]|uniref:hypothetical protein n=1 Tax=Dyadobacter sp. 3J3 TaxID=2606600 RepID=UPI00135A1DB2|nr:hypothetical protein [Dyadobacter sp. 3J3]
MIKKQQIYKALFAACILFSSSAVFAQVKIGTNPTVIGATNNLEVEATNNKKVNIRKADGTVVVENTPPGAVTDSIVTVDASGNIKAIDKATLKKKLGLSGSSSMLTSATQNMPAGSQFIPDFTTVLFDEQNGIDLTNNLFNISLSGTYTVSCTIKALIPGPFTGTQDANIDIYLQKFVSGAWAIISSVQKKQNATATLVLTLSVTDQFVAGDKIRLMIQPCIGCIAGNPDYPLYSANFFALRNL